MTVARIDERHVSTPVRPELSLDGGWRLGERSFAKLLEIFSPLRPSTILEFGSGVSTCRLALAFPEARITSVEHDPGFHEETKRLVESLGLGDRVDVRLSPLGYRRVAGRLLYSYRDFPRVSDVDCVLIDGPPGYTITGRQACLYECFGAVRVGGVIVLDDFGEPRERATLRRWLRAYPEAFRAESVLGSHELLVVRKIRESDPRSATPRDLTDNARDNLRCLASRAVCDRAMGA